MINTNNLSLGERVKYVRKETKQKQLEFAESLGISQSHLSGIEKNSVKPSLTIIKLICNKYNINEDWLLNGIGEPIDLGNLISEKACYARYKYMNSCFEAFFKECENADNLASLVAAYSFTVSIFSYSFDFKDKKNTSDYLKLIMNILNELEKLIHHLKYQGVSSATFNYMSNINRFISELPKIYCE